MTNPAVQSVLPAHRRAKRGWVASCVLALAVTAGMSGAGIAEAAETQPDSSVSWVTRPVDPQPVVAGHEGDVLLQVNVVMAAKTAYLAKTAKTAKGTSAKHRR